VEQQSVWLATAELPRFETASGEIAADLAVVGGGLVGLTTALLAARDGANVVVLEADRLGSGTSGNTTGKVTSQHGMIYDELISRHGEDQARQYAEANHAAIHGWPAWWTSWESTASWNGPRRTSTPTTRGRSRPCGAKPPQRQVWGCLRAWAKRTSSGSRPGR